MRKIKLLLAIPLIFLAAIAVYSALPWVLIFLFGQLEPNPPHPENPYGEFPFRVVYVIDGETKIIEDTLICEFDGFGWHEGAGKHIKWNAGLASGNKLAQISFSEDHLYGIELYHGFVEGQGGTRIVLDIGGPPYYLGYKAYTDYRPGRVRISSPLATGVISEEELRDKYKIQITEKKFSPPLAGNQIAVDHSSPYRDTETARLSVKGVAMTPLESSYPPNTAQVAFLIKNNTDKPLLLKQSFYMQKKMDGKWEDVYRDMAAGFSQEQIMIEPHAQITQIYDIAQYTKEIPVGHYRVISPVLVPVKQKTYDSKVLSGEFCVSIQAKECGGFPE